MAVTALVLTLSDDKTERKTALSELTMQPGVPVGDPFGVRLPVVVDTESTREDKLCFERIEAIDGVHLIELVSVDYDVEPACRVPLSPPCDERNEAESSDGAGSAP